MHWSFQNLSEVVAGSLSIGALGWCCWLGFKGAKAKGPLIWRLLVTMALALFFAFQTIPLLEGQGLVQFTGVAYTMILGIIAAAMWAPQLGGAVGGFFGGLYDGGDLQAEAKPFYSIFRAKRGRGKYFEALAEVRKQLAKFPDDFEGQTLLAELQAENLNDLPGAELTILRTVNQSGQSAANIAASLNRLADWHLKLSTDREAAEAALQKIIELLPDSEMSSRAAQRIAHLGDTEKLIAAHQTNKIEMKKGMENLGLVRGENGRLRVPEVEQQKRADDLVRQLEEHPLDTHAREELAVLYATHFHRLDLAMDQLEQLIAHSNHTRRQITHWLNKIADLQVKEGATYEQVKTTLERVVELNPELAASEVAQRRIESLRTELKGRESQKEVQLGVYEQNIGLKRKR